MKARLALLILGAALALGACNSTTGGSGDPTLTPTDTPVTSPATSPDQMSPSASPAS